MNDPKQYLDKGKIGGTEHQQVLLPPTDRLQADGLPDVEMLPPATANGAAAPWIPEAARLQDNEVGFGAAAAESPRGNAEGAALHGEERELPADQEEPAVNVTKQEV